MPTPEEFYLLSRVKGKTSVSQLCAASGWGKEKAKTTISKLIEFGLLVPDGEDAEATDRNSASTQEAPAVEPDETAPRGGPGANDPDATPEKTSAQTQEGPAVDVTSDAAATALGPDETPLARERKVTPEAQPAVERMQSPSREESPTPVKKDPVAPDSTVESGEPASDDGFGGLLDEPPVRDDPPVRDESPSTGFASTGFDLPVIEEDEDDLFMSDSPAHLSKLRGNRAVGPGAASVESDASNTKPVDQPERAGEAAALESSSAPQQPEPVEEPSVPEDDPGAGFAILDSEVAESEREAEKAEDQTRMLDPTSLDIANSVAVDGSAVETNRGGAAVEGPLAFAMLPGEVSSFSLSPDLLDPQLEIDPAARQEVAYVAANLDSVNYYQLFGLTQEASRKEIKKAYFVLSKRFHPDLYFRKNVGPFGEMVEQVFKAVTGAYQILSNRKKRAAYDEELKHAQMVNRSTASEASSESSTVDPLAEKKELARELLLKRAATHEVKGEFVRAADALRKAISIRPEPSLMVKLANALYRANKRLDDAAKYCRNALREEPKNLDGMLLLARILERNEAFEDALQILERARQIAPDEASIGVHEDRIRNLMGQA